MLFSFCSVSPSRSLIEWLKVCLIFSFPLILQVCACWSSQSPAQKGQANSLWWIWKRGRPRHSIWVWDQRWRTGCVFANQHFVPLEYECYWRIYCSLAVEFLFWFEITKFWSTMMISSPSIVMTCLLKIDRLRMSPSWPESTYHLELCGKSINSIVDGAQRTMWGSKLRIMSEMWLVFCFSMLQSCCVVSILTASLTHEGMALSWDDGTRNGLWSWSSVTKTVFPNVMYVKSWSGSHLDWLFMRYSCFAWIS